MSPLISFEADDERCASERTSLATTANPRPCSPARAASTAALSARMLVWNATLSIMHRADSNVQIEPLAHQIDRPVEQLQLKFEFRVTLRHRRHRPRQMITAET